MRYDVSRTRAVIEEPCKGTAFNPAIEKAGGGLKTYFLDLLDLEEV